MPWTTPETGWVTGELVGASDMNNIGENLNVLYSTVRSWKQHRVGTTLSTTSTTFVDADATNLALTLTPLRAQVAVIATVGAVTVSGTGYFDISVNGVRLGDASVGLGDAVATARYITMMGVATVTPNALVTIKIQYRHPSGTVQVTNALPNFNIIAWEL